MKRMIRWAALLAVTASVMACEEPLIPGVEPGPESARVFAATTESPATKTAQAGFSSRSTFFRNFKAQTGMTPMQWIVQQKGDTAHP